MNNQLTDAISDINADYCLVSMALEDLENIFMQEEREGRAFLIKAIRMELNRITNKLIGVEVETKNYVRKD